MGAPSASMPADRDCDKRRRTSPKRSTSLPRLAPPDHSLRHARPKNLPGPQARRVRPGGPIRPDAFPTRSRGPHSSLLCSEGRPFRTQGDRFFCSGRCVRCAKQGSLPCTSIDIVDSPARSIYLSHVPFLPLGASCSPAAFRASEPSRSYRFT